jgi:hypothetical protein
MILKEAGLQESFARKAGKITSAIVLHLVNVTEFSQTHQPGC